MSTFNQQILIGRLGKDVELKQTRGGKTLATFPVATDDGYMNQQTGEWSPNVNWHRVVVYRDQLAARLAERIHKGDLVFVLGRWEHSAFTDANGEVRYSAEVVAQRVFLLSEVRATNAAASDASHMTSADQEQTFPEDCFAEPPAQSVFDHPSTLSETERASLVDGEGNF